ncbi:hypothetical protein P4S64_19205 [Vibrio sp. M60_M31a]
MLMRGLSKAERISLVTDMRHRITKRWSIICGMQASKGNEAFIANIKDGHHLAYLADIEYLQNNSHHIADVLMCDECSIAKRIKLISQREAFLLLRCSSLNRMLKKL